MLSSGIIIYNNKNDRAREQFVAMEKKGKIPESVNRHKWLIVIIGLYLGSAAVRGLLGDFPKALRIYPDELRYLSIARSLFQGQGLRLHNLDCDFQKILYSICMIPAFFLQSTAAQIRAIGYLNSLIVASSVFPVYGLCRRLLGIDREIKVILAFWVTLPTSLVSMYFMSEVIFLPLSLWVVWCVWSILCTEKFARKLGLNFLLGFLFYLAYLNKEIALYFLISYLVVCLIRLFAEPATRRSEIICLPVAAITFACCFLFMKATLFHGLDNSYSSSNLYNISVLQLSSHPEKIAYLLYAFAYDTIFAVLAFGLFPVVIPFAVFDKNNKESLLYLFLLISFLIGCMVIAYTITLPEEFGVRSPRQHLRYLEPLMIPFLILTINSAKRLVSLKQTARYRLRFGVLAVCTLLYLTSFVVLGAGGGSALVDNNALVYYEFSSRFVFKSDIVMLFLRILMATVFGVGLFVLHKKQRTFIRLFCILFIALNVVNSAIGYCATLYRYKITEEQRTQASAANDYLHNIQGNILLISKEGLEAEDNRLFDTYVSRNFYVTELDMLETDRCLDDMILDLSSESVRCVFPSQLYSELKEVDYLVVKNGYDIHFQASSVEEMSDFPLDGYCLYRNRESDKIYFSE